MQDEPPTLLKTFSIHTYKYDGHSETHINIFSFDIRLENTLNSDPHTYKYGTHSEAHKLMTFHGTWLGTIECKWTINL